MLKIFVFVLCMIISSTFAASLTILHYNDIDSQLESFQRGTDPPQLPSGDTAGGVARLMTEINDQKAATIGPGHKLITIATSNLVAGQNGWLSILKWNAFGKLVKDVYKPDFTGLGLREFESDLPRTIEYLEIAKMKPIVSNINMTTCGAVGTSERKFCNELTEPYRIIDVEGVKVGIVGFVNPTAMQLSDPGNLKFRNISDALNDILEDPVFTNVNTIIAIGSGSETIAKNIIDGVTSEKLKLVIYGGIAKNMTADFPMEYKEKYIATALKFGQSLGKIVLNFDGNGAGTVDKANSKLISVGSQQEEVDAKEIINTLKEEIINQTETIGKTLVKLDGKREACWKSECNLGNLIADSMVYCAITDDKVASSRMIDIVSIWHSGAIFDDTALPDSQINTLDIHKWLPYHNNAYMVAVKGSILKRMFGTAGSALNTGGDVKDWGQFLQVSNGFEVRYTPKGELVSLRTMHINDSKPILDDVKDDANYNLVIPSILYEGKSLYDYLPGNFLPDPITGKDFQSLGYDDECLENYIRAMKVLKIGFEERIFIVNDVVPTTTTNPSPTTTEQSITSTTTTTTAGPTPTSAPDCKCSCKKGLTVFLTLLIATIIIALGIVGVFVIWPRYKNGNTSSFP